MRKIKETVREMETGDKEPGQEKGRGGKKYYSSRNIILVFYL